MSVAGQQAIKAAMAIAGDVAEGRLAPSAFDAAAVEACRELLEGPSAPGDPLWGLRGEVCRQHLAAGGIPSSELAEWTAVARSRERAGNAIDVIPGPQPDSDSCPLASTESDEQVRGDHPVTPGGSAGL